MIATPAVEAIGLWKSYELGDTTVPALKGLSLSIAPGEFTAVVGASGSGKSTLLNLLSGLDRPDRGQVKIAGEDIGHLSDDKLGRLRNLRIGFVFQSFHLIPVLSVYENVELPLQLRENLSAGERQKLVLEALRDVSLEEFSGHMPTRLSGGQRQRVAIARALVTRPSIVFADEPTANLDSKTAHGIIDLMQDLNKRHNVSFLISSHDEKLISRVSRVVRMADGVLQ